MNFYKCCVSCWLRCVMVIFSIAIASCGVQNKIATLNNIAQDRQSFHWRIEIKIQTYNNGVYNVLAVLESNPQPISLIRFNHLSEITEPGTIVVYVTATNNQVDRLRQSLLEGGAIAVFENKSNSN